MDKKAVIYIRVSDPSQIENNSLGTQEISCRQFAKVKGFEVVKVFREEGRSAKHVNTRPVLMEIFSLCCRKSSGISAIIVYKLDRFSRNLEEGLAAMSLLAKYNVEVMSVIEDIEPSPMGTAMRSIMMTLSQLDNELKGERVKDNMIASFRKGMWPFKCPIGYKRQFKTKEENKGLPPIQDPSLSPLLKQMFEKAATGIYSKSQLARELNLAGFAELYGAKANHKIVKEILEKTFYYGSMYAKKWNEYTLGKHEPLIDKVTWDKAYQRVILKKKGYTYQDATLYPLKGSLRCAVCRELMTSSPSRGRNRVVYYYECKNKKCRKVRIEASKAHQQFLDILLKIQPSRNVMTLFSHMVMTEWDQVINQAKEAAEKLDGRLLELKGQFDSIRRSKDEGIYTVEEARTQADGIRREIVVVEIERSEARLEQYDAEIVQEFIAQFLMNLGRLWEDMDISKKQALQKKIFVGDLFCTLTKEIRIETLSRSFKLIAHLKDNNGKIVTPSGFEPEFVG
jgi:site-specific DNA recombinase